MDHARNASSTRRKVAASTPAPMWSRSAALCQAGTAGAINGTDSAAHNTNRVGVGTGVFSLGSPRQIEFSLKIIF